MKTLARQRDKAELLLRLKGVRPGSQGRWGRMSAHQMICHLCDSFRMVAGHKSVSSSSSVMQRTIVKWIALYAPLPWPAGIPTRPEVDQEIGGTGPVDFAEDVAQLEALLESAVAQIGTADCPAHPIFGRMSETAWLRWGYLHVDHHLRQFGV
jgi:hypothetical protein